VNASAQGATEERTIAVIPKNSREELRVGLSTYNGVELVNLRVWFNTGSGDMRPGKAGFALKVEKLPELQRAIANALEQARADGLL
jgi:hypothetical protein